MTIKFLCFIKLSIGCFSNQNNFSFTGPSSDSTEHEIQCLLKVKTKIDIKASWPNVIILWDRGWVPGAVPRTECPLAGKPGQENP